MTHWDMGAGNNLGKSRFPKNNTEEEKECLGKPGIIANPKKKGKKGKKREMWNTWNKNE